MRKKDVKEVCVIWPLDNLVKSNISLRIYSIFNCHVTKGTKWGFTETFYDRLKMIKLYGGTSWTSRKHISFMIGSTEPVLWNYVLMEFIPSINQQEHLSLSVLFTIVKFWQARLGVYLTGAFTGLSSLTRKY